MTEFWPFLVAGLAAFAVLLIFMGLTARSDVSVRLERYASTAPAPTDEKQQRRDLGNLITSSAAIASLNKVVERRDWGANMARDLARADLALKPTEWLAIRAAILLAVPLLLMAIGFVIPGFNNPIVWLVGLVAGWFIPRFWLGRRQGARLKAFNDALADTITLLANSLRAGSSFLQSIDMVVKEGQPPISTEFARVVREVNLGLTLEQALTNLTRRVRSDDLDLLVTAIVIQAQVGGNLAEILDSIAFTIRERVRIKGEIRTLTAQGRMSSWVVGCLPVALFAILSVLAPSFIAPLFESELGIGMLVIGVISMLIGFAAIRRIVSIEV